MLTAPYNFVPLADRVIRPQWAASVSMELPFPHALCGSFDLVIEAVTPLMIGGETLRPPEGVNAETEKRNFALFDRTALPGTSLKGALRAVIEIATFSKIGNRIDDRRFSVRDLQNPYLYTARFNDMFRPLSRAGWLSIDPGSGDWRLRACDYSLVRQTDLEALHTARARRGAPLQLGKARLTAVGKYRGWADMPLELRFNPDEWRARDDWAKGRIVSRADNVGSGRTLGTIVFTGQPGNREPHGKAVEFIFHLPENYIPVPAQVREDFEHVHRNPNTRTPTPEWAYHRTRLLTGQPVPVFWLATAEDADRISAMGLAMMFRLAYDRTTRQLAATASDDHLSEDPDFAETMFGFVREAKSERKDHALAGRISVEPARLEHAAPEEPMREAILLSPKPSFYPAYVAQRHVDLGSKPPRVMEGTYRGGDRPRSFKAYTTYMDRQAVLRGWKRYPVSNTLRPAPQPGPDQPEVNSREVFTRFTALGPGTRFRTTVHVHNLRTEEMGALLWAISFGDPAKGYCHSLGLGRALGYGCVRISIDPDSVDLEDVDDDHPWRGSNAAARLVECQRAFETYMDKQVRGWSQSAQIRTLQAMADATLGDSKAKELAPMAGPGPFQDAKREGLILAPYVEAKGVWPVPAPPPSVGVATPRGARQRSQARTAPPPRFGLLDGERVEVLTQDGNILQVRLADGSIDFVRTDEVTLE